MQGITMLPEALLYKEFGVNAEFIIDHAWGRESCTMEDIHNYRGKSRSLSNSQILFEDYDVDGARIVMKEMVENLVLELVEENLYAKGISLYIRYSKDCNFIIVRLIHYMLFRKTITRLETFDNQKYFELYDFVV